MARRKTSRTNTNIQIISPLNQGDTTGVSLATDSVFKQQADKILPGWDKPKQY